MKKLTYTLLILITFSTGCDDDFLDTSPYDGIGSSVIFENDANALMAMNGVYNAMAQNAFYDQFAGLTTNIGPDGFSFGRAPWGMSLTRGTGTSRDPQIGNLYTKLYRPIIYANDIIANVPHSEGVSPELRDRLVGEAKFIRGLCYFYLMNIWGGVVILDEPMMPTETFLPRNTLEEVRTLVIDDFTDAVAKLDVSYPASDLGRVTKGAAIAMLGKAYLYNEQWDLAHEQFEKLLQAPYTYDLVDNYGDSFDWKTQNNKESVFEIQYVAEDGLGSAFEARYGNRSGGRGGQDYCEASATCLSVFTNKDGTPIDLSTIPRQSDYATEIEYGEDLIEWYTTSFADADIRLHQSVIMPGSKFFGNNDKYYKVYWPYQPYVNADTAALRTTWTTTALLPIRKFLTVGEENILHNQNAPTNFPLIRFADVLLMYAEALNETNGPVTEVYAAVDRVRNRAGVVDLPTDLDKDQMRRQIWLERYKEFMFESHLYFDVKRWRVAHTNDPIFGLNKDEIDFRLVHPESVLYTRVFSEEKDYLWPIPGGERDLNPKLDQNPHW